MPEHDLVSRLMHALFEGEPSALLRLLQRPAGEHARDFGHIFLCIASVHAQRMQLHQFAPVVFI